MLPAWLFNVLRTLAFFVYAWLVAHLATWGVVLPDGMLSEVIVLGVFVALTTAALRYAESRTGNDLVSRILRTVGRLLMLGLSSAQPVYAPPPKHDSPPAVVMAENGLTRPALK